MSDLKAQVTRIRSNTKVTQIIVSRVVKLPRGGGDVFVSLTANYGTPDDLSEGLTQADVRTATHLLGMDANILAHEQAAAGGIISQTQMQEAVRKIKGNFSYLIKGGENP